MIVDGEFRVHKVLRLFVVGSQPRANRLPCRARRYLVLSETTNISFDASRHIRFLLRHSTPRCCQCYRLTIIMASDGAKPLGVTAPLSTALPTEAENQASNALIEELKRQGNYESTAETNKR